MALKVLSCKFLPNHFVTAFDLTFEFRPLGNVHKICSTLNAVRICISSLSYLYHISEPELSHTPE